MNKTWTKEDDDKLRELVSSGTSYREIGKAFGVSKDAAIGRAWRQGMMQAKKKATALNDRLAALDLFPRFGRCVFPIGHPGAKDFRFCGEAIADVTKPYCEDHRQKASVSAARTAAWSDERKAQHAALMRARRS